MKDSAKMSSLKMFLFISSTMTPRLCTYSLSSCGVTVGESVESEDEARRASHNVLERKRRNDLKSSFQVSYPDFSSPISLLLPPPVLPSPSFSLFLPFCFISLSLFSWSLDFAISIKIMSCKSSSANVSVSRSSPHWKRIVFGLPATDGAAPSSPLLTVTTGLFSIAHTRGGDVMTHATFVPPQTRLL